jgi:type II secretory pathway component PulF
MYTLFNNIVSDTIHSIVVCVDFLGTHMMSLVFFIKLGVTIYKANLKIIKQRKEMLTWIHRGCFFPKLALSVRAWCFKPFELDFFL